MLTGTGLKVTFSLFSNLIMKITLQLPVPCCFQYPDPDFFHITLLWFNPSQQSSPRQPLPQSPTSGAGERIRKVKERKKTHGVRLRKLIRKGKATHTSKIKTLIRYFPRAGRCSATSKTAEPHHT